MVKNSRAAIFLSWKIPDLESDLLAASISLLLFLMFMFVVVLLLDSIYAHALGMLLLGDFPQYVVLKIVSCTHKGVRENLFESFFRQSLRPMRLLKLLFGVVVVSRGSFAM